MSVKSNVPTPHIEARAGEIAETILLPGDPLRAKYIAENFLSDVKQFNSVRNMFGYTGTYEGKPVSVMGTGMGCPAMGIYSYELIHFYGVKNLIRIGTAGSIHPDVHIRDLVFGIGAPYESYSTNAYYGDDGVLLYEHEDWMPAGGALWWFSAESVTLDPYSQIVVAIKNAINHTKTNPNSVDLSKSDYYWMCNVGLGMMYDKARGYNVDENIPQDHYLTGKAFAMTPTGWPLSTGSPTFFIGKMPRDEAQELCLYTDGYDKTLGAMFTCIKFPKANMYDAVEIWAKGNEATSHVRFSADVNSNYVLLTPKLGYSVYRNVDKEATEALPENEGKLVYGYTGGTDDVEGSTDPSGIDAEASIANGAHIIYSDTNDSFIDFHQKKVASLKK